jgi:branched-chain amino acid transport system substrate-binding protein
VHYLVKVRRLRANQIAVFAQQDGFGDSGYAGVEKAVRARGEAGEAPNLRLGYQRNSIDVTAALADLRKHKKDVKAVVIVATYRAAAKFIEKAKDVIPGLIYTNVSAVGSSALAEELMLLGPKFAAGVVVTQCVPDPNGFSSLALEYKAALAKYFPAEQPDYVSFEGYVDGKILLEALRRAGPNPDSEKVVDGFENIHDVEMGLGVPIGFGRGDHQAVHKVWGTQLDAAGHYQSIDLK